MFIDEGVEKNGRVMFRCGGDTVGDPRLDVGGEFPITAISGDSGPPIFPLEIDEHDKLGANDTNRERSVDRGVL